MHRLHAAIVAGQVRQAKKRHRKAVNKRHQRHRDRTLKAHGVHQALRAGR